MSNPSPLNVLLDGALSLLFPPRCEVCHTLQEPVFCASCLETVTRISAPVCRQCGLPMDPRAQGGDQCRECREDPPAFATARAAGMYSGALRTAIHAFKYDGVRALAAPLAGMMCETITLPFPVDCLCPVPLHPSREAMRGYNQSRLLADVLAEAWQAPVAADLLARTSNTVPQMELPREARKRNVANAFTAAPAAQGRSIGLIDDVYTTGSTLRECSRILIAAGAARILVLTVARTTPTVA